MFSGIRPGRDRAAGSVRSRRGAFPANPPQSAHEQRGLLQTIPLCLKRANLHIPFRRGSWKQDPPRGSFDPGVRMGTHSEGSPRRGSREISFTTPRLPPTHCHRAEHRRGQDRESRSVPPSRYWGRICQGTFPRTTVRSRNPYRRLKSRQRPPPGGSCRDFPRKPGR